MRRRLVPVLASVLLAGPVHAGEGAEPGTLVVEGRGGTTTTWTYDGPPVQVELPSVRLSGGDDHAGAVLEQVDAAGVPVVLGAVLVRAWGDGAGEQPLRVGTGSSLEPGRYRVTLLGDGPVRLRLRLSGTERALRVVPRTPVRTGFAARSPVGSADGRPVVVDLPAAVPAGRRAVVLTSLSGPGVQVLDTCTTRDGRCPRPTTPYVVTGGTTHRTSSLAPAEAAPRGVRWRWRSAGAVGELHTAVVAF